MGISKRDTRRILGAKVTPRSTTDAVKDAKKTEKEQLEEMSTWYGYTDEKKPWFNPDYVQVDPSLVNKAWTPEQQAAHKKDKEYHTKVWAKVRERQKKEQEDALNSAKGYENQSLPWVSADTVLVGEKLADKWPLSKVMQRDDMRKHNKEIYDVYTQYMVDIFNQAKKLQAKEQAETVKADDDYLKWFLKSYKPSILS